MTRSYVQVANDGPGKKIAVDEITDGADTVERQIVRVAGLDPTELQDVRNAAPGASDYGAVVRIAGGVAVDVSALATEATALLELAKLTAIADSTDGLEGFVDGLETLITSLNGFVDGLEGLITTLNAKAFLTDAELRASPVPVSASALPLPSGAATEASLAAVAASVDGLEGLAATLNTLVDGLEGFVDGLEAALATLNAKAFLTNTELRATAVPVSGPLTDAQLRATAVPVSGTVAMSGMLVAVAYDYLALTVGSTTDTWAYKNGGAGGTLVATVTITYTGTDKLVIVSVVRT